MTTTNYWEEKEKKLTWSGETELAYAVFKQFLADKAQHEKEIAELKEENKRKGEVNLGLNGENMMLVRKCTAHENEITELTKKIEEIKKNAICNVHIKPSDCRRFPEGCVMLVPLEKIKELFRE